LEAILFINIIKNMFNLFKKKIVNCEKCFKPSEKYHKFDPSYRGQFRDAKKMKLCTLCLMKEYKDYLNKFRYNAIVVEPLNKYTAYQYYTFEDMIKNDWWPSDEIEKLRKIASKGNCVKCDEETSLTLCSPEIYHNEPADGKFYTDDIENLNMKHLCSDCLCDHIEKIIREKNIFFDEVFPIRTGDGLMTSFET